MAVKLKLKDTRDRKNRKLTRKHVHQAAKRCKNWGRWGKDDEIGTLTSPPCGHRRRGASRAGGKSSRLAGLDQKGPQARQDEVHPRSAASTRH